MHKYDGPDHITEENLAHARQRELELIKQREQQSKLIDETAKQQMTDNQLELLRQIEPPWSWIHEFAQQNNMKKSYNFIECESIPSNATPAESSDESFDFERGKFISSASSDTTLDSEDSCEIAAKIELLPKQNSELSIKTDVTSMANDFINEIIDTIITDKKIDIATDTKSLLSFLEQEIGKKDENNLNMIALERYLLEAENKGMKFENLDQLQEYLKEKFGVISLGRESGSAALDIEIEQSEELQPVGKIDDMKEQSIDEPYKEEAVVVEPAQPQLASKFNECDIEIDDNVANKSISDNMILGLVDNNESVVDESTVLSSPRSLNTFVAELSEKVQQTSPATSTAESSDTEQPPEENKITPPTFNCTICHLPGIGKTISKQTQKNFLTYLKGRSQNERGMIFPRHFKERKCPNMIDCNEDDEE